MTQEDFGVLISLGEASPLKVVLNRAIAALLKASETVFQPHICLNGIEGVEVINRISANPETADTMFELVGYPIIYGDDIWLNTSFSVFLDEAVYPTNHVALTPRQSGFIVRRLSLSQQQVVVEKVKAWFLEVFRPNIEKGLEVISTQFNEGDPLVESDRENRIFDIHGGRLEIPYTEGRIVGLTLFKAVVWRAAPREGDKNDYQKADQLVEARRLQQGGSIESFLRTASSLRDVLRD